MTNLIESVEFYGNSEARCPCVLILDTSSSMQGQKIEALNQAIQLFKDELSKDELSSQRIEIAVVTFDSRVTVISDFVAMDDFEPPTLVANGATHMGEAIQTSLNLVRSRMAKLRENKIPRYKPWAFLITDGQPQGEDARVVEEAVQRVVREESKNLIAFFAVGVEGADMDFLRQLTTRCAALSGLKFKELFEWLYLSLKSVSESNPGDDTKPADQVPLKPIDNWTV